MTRLERFYYSGYWLFLSIPVAAVIVGIVLLTTSNTPAPATYSGWCR
jgi:hypothetical protein